MVVMPIGTVKLTAPHATLLETDGQNCTGRDHCGRAFQVAQFRRRERRDRHVLRELRSGNPRRRFDMVSKGSVLVQDSIARHTNLQ